jgi:hypothetical protein
VHGWAINSWINSGKIQGRTSLRATKPSPNRHKPIDPGSGVCDADVNRLFTVPKTVEFAVIPSGTLNTSLPIGKIGAVRVVADCIAARDHIQNHVYRNRRVESGCALSSLLRLAHNP